MVGLGPRAGGATFGKLPKPGILGGRARRLVILVTAMVLAAWASPAIVLAGDSPGGFWYGADGNYPQVSGSAPYSEPNVGGTFGGYLAEIGGWPELFGCAENNAVNTTDVNAANTNFYNYGGGVGTGPFWFMAGPGLDPKYDGTTGEAYDWGEKQAEQAQYDLRNFTYATPFDIMWMDIEAGGSAGNGWNHVYSVSIKRLRQ